MNASAIQKIQKIPALSVVIRCKNEIATLPEVVTQMKLQTFTDYELIIVDNESTDGTKEFAETVADKVVTVKANEFTHAKSTNAGLDASEGNYIYFTNGHSILIDRDMFRIATKLMFEKDYLGGIFGNVIASKKYGANKVEELGNHINTLTGMKNYTEYSDFQPGILHTISSVIKGTLARQFRFSEMKSGGGEDIYLARQILKSGYKIAFHPSLNVYHSHGGKNRKAIKRFLKYGSMTTEAMLKPIDPQVNS